VTAEVPSLFESGSLRAHTGLDSEPPQARKSRLGRVAAVAFVGAAIVFAVLHFRHAKDATAAAPAPDTLAMPAAPAAAPPSPEPTVANVRPAAIPAVENVEAAAPSVVAAPLPPASAQAAPSQRASFVAVTKPAHSQASATPRPAPSVPSDMLYNPYR
jgi:hypothetical protein